MSAVCTQPYLALDMAIVDKYEATRVSFVVAALAEDSYFRASREARDTLQGGCVQIEER